MIERINVEGYAGDVTPKEAWAVLSAEPDAQLVDVRSAAEWAFVGFPDLARLEKTTQCVEWQRFPGMARVAEFADQMLAKLKSGDAKAGTPVFFICRSGVRSAAAARMLTEFGYSAAYNISGGFEGDLDGDRHRAGVSGWKYDGLPWVQT